MPETAKEISEIEFTPHSKELIQRLKSGAFRDQLEVIEDDDDLEKEKARQQIRHADQLHYDGLEETRLERELKKTVAFLVFGLLILETLLIFLVLILQGFKFQNFSVNDTTLNIFLPATVLQISSMAIIITKYLFDGKKKNGK